MTEYPLDYHRERISLAAREWMIALDAYPGWRDWNRGKLSHTLHFDEPIFGKRDDHPDAFEFDEETSKQHAVIMRYFTLLQTPMELRDLEFYFRRFPYKGTPITRYAHLSNVCELYFSRHYQYKERAKQLFADLKRAVPGHRGQVGPLIKLLGKEFADEMRERNLVHHHARFEDLEISRVFVIENVLLRDPDLARKGWVEEHRRVYRLAARVWAKRCLTQADRLDAFTEAIAEALLKICSFLKVPDMPSEYRRRGKSEHG